MKTQSAIQTLRTTSITTGEDSVDRIVGAYILDKHGREIKPGDVLKVFHFIGARRNGFGVKHDPFDRRPIHCPNRLKNN